jgi:hypothetical protein
MNSLAMNRHHVTHNDTASEFCVLAVEPDSNQAAILEQALKGRIPGKLTVVDSTEAALKALVDAIPDLVLVSPLLPPRTEDQFLEHLRVLGVDASHLQLLSIPRFGDDQPPAGKKRTFGSFGLKKLGGGAVADNVASAFAEEVAACLGRLSEVRSESSISDSGMFDPPEQDAPGVRLEHLEHLLDRLQPDELEPLEQPPTNELEEATSDEAITKRDVMPMPTAQEFTGSETDTARLPRFLTLDQQISPPLRSVLDEADGCLKMAFLTGGGACAVRGLDLLLAEQGIVDTDRAHQLRELGKKHPAVAESFLRILLQVMTDSSAIWDAARLTLAIALLKAIAHEIYVLGPERTERATYVLGLLERFNAGVRGGSAA